MVMASFRKRTCPPRAGAQVPYLNDALTYAVQKLNSCFVNLSLQAVNRATHSFELRVVVS